MLLSLPSSAKEEACIGLVLGGADNFFQSVQQGASQAGASHGVKVLHRGPSGFDKLSAQIRIINTLRNSGCNAFVIAPIGPEVDEVVNVFWQQGVPTVYIDRDTDGEHDAVSVIATDNYKAGKQAGERMIKALSGKGSIAILRLNKGITSTDKREKGFYDVVTKAGLEVVVDEYLGVDVGDAYQNAKQMIDRLSAVQGIFTPNETTTESTLRAMGRAVVDEKPIHIGFDLSPSIAKGVESGLIYGVIIQDPFGMGYEGVASAMKARLGKSVPKKISTQTHFVTKDNLAEHIE